MKKEELLELVSHNNIEIHNLVKNESYIAEIEVGDMPKEQVVRFCSVLSEKFKEVGLQNTIIVPTCRGIGKFTFFRVKDKRVFEVD